MGHNFSPQTMEDTLIHWTFVHNISSTFSHHNDENQNLELHASESEVVSCVFLLVHFPYSLSRTLSMGFSSVLRCFIADMVTLCNALMRFFSFSMHSKGSASPLSPCIQRPNQSVEILTYLFCKVLPLQTTPFL